jgi:hypothetical protein
MTCGPAARPPARVKLTQTNKAVGRTAGPGGCKEALGNAQKDV